jgi:hypothetical protein
MPKQMQRQRAIMVSPETHAKLLKMAKNWGVPITQIMQCFVADFSQISVENGRAWYFAVRDNSMTDED